MNCRTVLKKKVRELAKENCGYPESTLHALVQAYGRYSNLLIFMLANGVQEARVQALGHALNTNPLKQIIGNYGLGDYFESLWETYKGEDHQYRGLLEYVNDELNSLQVKNKRGQFINNLFSKKYAVLRTPESERLIGQLYDQQATFQVKALCKKMLDYLPNKAAEFECALETLWHGLGKKRTFEGVVDFCQTAGATITYQDEKNGIVIADVNESYPTLRDLGTPKWCIWRDYQTFSDYLRKFSKQYIIYNTKRPATDPRSMVGVTIDLNGHITAAYDQDDNDYDRSQLGPYLPYMPTTSPQVIRTFIKKGYENYEAQIQNYPKLLAKHKRELRQNVLNSFARYGLVDDVRRFINDPNVDIYTVFFQGCVNGRVNVTELLLGDPRLNPTADQIDTILHFARVGNEHEMIAFLKAHPRIRKILGG